MSQPGPPPAYEENWSHNAVGGNANDNTNVEKGQPLQPGYSINPNIGSYPPPGPITTYPPPHPGYLPPQGYYPPPAGGYTAPPGGYALPPQGYPQQVQPGQTTVIITQPGGIAATTVPDNYSAFAWLTCLFCCFILGLISVIKSNEVNSAVSEGDLNRARAASNSTKRFAFMALGIGLFFHFLWIIYLVVI